MIRIISFKIKLNSYCYINFICKKNNYFKKIKIIINSKLKIIMKFKLIN